MKKVYISVDIEGMEGIVSRNGILRGQGDFNIARKRLAEDVNAAVRACFDSGVEEVVVCDGHGDMENLIIEDMDTRVKLISGAMRNSLQMENMNAKFDALIVFGHAGAGVSMTGVLNHCYNGKKIYNMKMNGQLMNTEAVQNAVIAGYYGVPLIAIIGDDAVGNEVEQFVPNVEKIVVKEAITRFCAISIHPEKAREKIYNGVKAAIARAEEIKPLKISEPICLEVEYKETNMAEVAALLPIVERISPRAVTYTGSAENVFRMQDILVLRLVDEI